MDSASRMQLAGQLHELLTFAQSDRLILTFDNDMADERSEDSGDDDLSCLGVMPSPSAFHVCDHEEAQSLDRHGASQRASSLIIAK